MVSADHCLVELSVWMLGCWLEASMPPEGPGSSQLG